MGERNRHHSDPPFNRSLTWPVVRSEWNYPLCGSLTTKSDQLCLHYVFNLRETSLFQSWSEKGVCRKSHLLVRRGDVGTASLSHQLCAHCGPIGSRLRAPSLFPVGYGIAAVISSYFSPGWVETDALEIMCSWPESMCDLYTCMDNVCARTGDDAWHQAVEVVKDQGLLCLAPRKHGSSKHGSSS